MISLVSGSGTVEKRDTSQTQIYQYIITIGKKAQINFELPGNMAILQTGQKVKVVVTTNKPKTRGPILVLRGNVNKIERTKSGTNYIIFFAGLQGQISTKRAIPGVKTKKPIYISISQ